MLIGEAEATTGQRGVGDLRRLEKIRSCLLASGHEADRAILGDVLPADLDVLYGRRPPLYG